MRVRLRIPELLADRQWTAYRLARESGGRISTSTAYRLVASGGKLDTYSHDLLEAVVDVFKPKAVTELFARDDPPPATKRARKRPA
jgi:hypothetical protein